MSAPYPALLYHHLSSKATNKYHGISIQPSPLTSLLASGLIPPKIPVASIATLPLALMSFPRLASYHALPDSKTFTGSLQIISQNFLLGSLANLEGLSSNP